MRKALAALLCVLLFSAAAANAQTLTGTAQGVHGQVEVQFDYVDGRITKVVVSRHTEHPHLGARAVAQLPPLIEAAGSTDVDVITGATLTSQAIIKAIDQAIQAAYPPPPGEARTLVGSAQGVHGLIEVSFDVEKGRITRVEVVKESEHPHMGKPALETMPQRIVAAGNTAVDVVSGSTLTSQAILAAINTAMENEGLTQTNDEVTTHLGAAQGVHGVIRVEFDTVGEVITRVAVISHREHPSLGAPAADIMPGRIMAAGHTKVDVVAGCTLTSLAILDAINQALAGNNEVQTPDLSRKPWASPSRQMKDGLYLGVAQGVYSPVQVGFEVQGGQIVKVQVLAHEEHPTLGMPAVELMPGRIAQAGDTNVDAVTGSTLTSDAIIQAIHHALTAGPMEGNGR